jgi:hypothetical protein
MMFDMKTEMMNSLTETIHATMESQWNEYTEEDNYNSDNQAKEHANAVDVDSLVQNFTTPTPVDGDLAANASGSCLGLLADEFSPSKASGPPISDKLALIVNSLLTEGLSKDPLSMTDRYLKPENCPLLETPKINNMIWSQLKPEVKNLDKEIAQPRRSTKQ